MRKQIPVIIDVTPWSRGPNTGVGLTAHLSFNAINQLIADEKTNQSNFKLRGVTRSKASGKYSHFSFFNRLFGWKNGIFHSFELKLSPVKRSKKVITVHDLWSLKPNPFQSSEFQSVQGPKLQRAVNETDHIVVPSIHVMNQLRTFFPTLTKPITVVPWGPTISTDEKVADSHELKQYLKLKRPYLLCVATFEARKNYELLLRAMTKTLSKDIDLVTVGQTGHGGDSARTLLSSMRQRYLKGLDLNKASSNDLQNLYAQCAGLVLVSHDEGFGLPVLEALSFGKPIIASDIPPLREIAGSRAQYIPLDEGEQPLSQAISNLFSSAWNKQETLLSQQRAKEFSWQATAKKTLAVYESLIS